MGKHMKKRVYTRTRDESIKRFWAKVAKTDHCWNWVGAKNRNGYGNFRSLHFLPTLLASRISWMIANGDIPIGLGVLHRCDNPACVRPDHLFLGTQKDNASDKMSKGRHPAQSGRTDYLPRGKSHHFYNRGPKMTRERAFLIRISAASNRALATLLGISPSMVSRIKTGECWRE